MSASSSSTVPHAGRSVAGSLCGRAGFQNKVSAGVVEFYRIGTAFSTQIVREIFGSEQCTADTRASRGDRANIDNSQRSFTYRKNFGAVRSDIQ